MKAKRGPDMGDIFNDIFSCSFIDENGNLNRMKSLTTPEDFVREAL
jgi:hypothetical protein